MTERPILFSGPMVRALLDGRKTQTRRVIKPQPHNGRSPDEVRAELVRLGALGPDESLKDLMSAAWNGGFIAAQCPYGAPSGRLWVRENGWERPDRTPKMMREGADTWAPYYYDADITAADHEQFKEWGFKRRPSIHMPRWACRLVLEITAIRVERLFDISEEDARAEGMMHVPFRSRYKGESTHGWARDEGQPVSTTARRAFEDLWYSINGAWLDVWVWVVEFRRVEAIKASA